MHSCEAVSLRLCSLAGGIKHAYSPLASCRYAGTARCTGFRKEGGRVVEVEAEYACLPEGAKAPKVRGFLPVPLQLLQGTIHAVSQRLPPASTSCLPIVTVCAGGPWFPQASTFADVW